MRTVVPPQAVLVPSNAARMFKGIIYDVYQWPQKRFDGSTATFEMLKRPDTVEVIAIADNGNLIAINDEQPHRGARFTLPGGRHDVETETELDCAKRELLEETGMSFAKWKLIAVKQPLTKIDWFIYTFLATGEQSRVAARPDAGGEKIKVAPIDFAKAKKIAHESDDQYWPNQILRSVGSVQELLALPEYAGERVGLDPIFL